MCKQLTEYRGQVVRTAIGEAGEDRWQQEAEPASTVGRKYKKLSLPNGFPAFHMERVTGVYRPCPVIYQCLEPAAL